MHMLPHNFASHEKLKGGANPRRVQPCPDDPRIQVTQKCCYLSKSNKQDARRALGFIENDETNLKQMASAGEGSVDATGS